MNVQSIKNNLLWDFSLEHEFSHTQRETGYTFVIDQFAAVPQLALYRIGPFSSHTEPLEQQPPRDLLVKALGEQCIAPSEDGLFLINQELREWVENNVLK